MEPSSGEWEGREWIKIDKLKANHPEYKDMDVEVAKGTVVLFDARLVHGAYSNNSKDRTRMSFFGHYCPGDLSFSWRGTDFSRGIYIDRHTIKNSNYN